MALPRWPDWDPAMKARDWTGSFERLGPYPPVGGTIGMLLTIALIYTKPIILLADVGIHRQAIHAQRHLQEQRDALVRSQLQI
jgi:limonene-1,2-epoxide hydrolase